MNHVNHGAGLHPVCHILITGQEGAASSYLTGCRSGEMLGLEWSRVDLENNRIWLQASHTKTKKAHTALYQQAGRA